MIRLPRIAELPAWNTLLRAAAFVLIPSATAWGQGTPAPLPGAPGQDKSYVYQYFLVALCFAMGLAMLYRPRPRKQEVERVAE